MTGTPLGARHIHLGLNFLCGRRGLVQSIQLLKSLSQTLGSGTAHPAPCVL
jgi:hypothetical protein